MSTVCTFYAGDGISFLNLRFENDVKMYGIQTDWCPLKPLPEFENDVKTYGIQTMMTGNITNMTFENDVKMHGIQTQSGQ